MSDSAAPADDLYAVIHRRRDVRVGFTGEPVDEAVLTRILAAAHAAPSVGLSQPWDFIVVDDADLKARFHAHVSDERQAFADSLPDDRRHVFDGIRIEGIRESTLSIVVTYDPDRAAPAVLGRHTIADTGLYSVCLAIQNLWLAATAEGLGVGWVSFYRERRPGRAGRAPGPRATGGLAVPGPGHPPRGHPRPGAAGLALTVPPRPGRAPQHLVSRFSPRPARRGPG